MNSSKGYIHVENHGTGPFGRKLFGRMTFGGKPNGRKTIGGMGHSAEKVIRQKNRLVKKFVRQKINWQNIIRRNGTNGRITHWAE